ncbi:hypothetical protein RRG08_029960 [Elysia crispata]|uniref:Uncharacterized protein n=1 Tax=Elysia crispata TaxID=231223 RepID=A0AAE0ZJD9_9GAST|nr:hypothetical protein RRG08_029960 [Elysia crispata]
MGRAGKILFPPPIPFRSSCIARGLSQPFSRRPASPRDRPDHVRQAGYQAIGELRYDCSVVHFRVLTYVFWAVEHHYSELELLFMNKPDLDRARGNLPTKILDKSKPIVTLTGHLHGPAMTSVPDRSSIFIFCSGIVKFGSYASSVSVLFSLDSVGANQLAIQYVGRLVASERGKFIASWSWSSSYLATLKKPAHPSVRASECSACNENVNRLGGAQALITKQWKVEKERRSVTGVSLRMRDLIRKSMPCDCRCDQHSISPQPLVEPRCNTISSELSSCMSNFRVFSSPTLVNFCALALN